MNIEEAKLLLSYHSGRNPDTHSEKWSLGFLGSLRPYTGKLIEENFRQVVECLRVLQAELHDRENIDREVVADITAICHLGRAWGVCKEGMLRRNRLINDADRERLARWVETILYTFMCILDGCDEETSFEDYRNYVSENPA
jgi:hypothetical protein